MTDQEVAAQQAGRVPDLDLRLVRYFVVVAEQGNFGRAAEELHIAQPSLSRQIQRLEQLVGARLLERTPRGSYLTDAGRAFLPHARGLLTTAARAVGDSRAAVATPTFTIGYVGDLRITGVARELRRMHPGLQVRTRHLGETEAGSALREGTVDGLVARLPLPGDGLDVKVLYEEARIVLVAADHPLADRESVTAGDLTGAARVACGAVDAEWLGFWRLEATEAPAPVASGAGDAFEDKLELVATGEAVAVLPATDRRPSTRDDVMAVPLEDAAPSQVAAAVRAGDPDPFAEAFLATATGLLSRAAETGRAS